MRVHLVDVNPEVVRAWRSRFRVFPEVEILEGDLLEVAACCVVAPANSYGFMDGGIDRAYVEFFGRALERRVRERISQRADGILPVGAAELVETGHSKIPYMIVAPTMLMPEAVPALNARRALAAALRSAATMPSIAVDGDLYCPGLTTLVGRVSPDDAAAEMAAAYGRWRET